MSRGFLIDTNVLSELMRTTPASEVQSWFARNVSQTMFVCSVTQAEILSGIALMPEGKKRSALAMAAELLFEQDMAGRCLDFGVGAAKNYALIYARRLRSGHPISAEDCQIAAIALFHDLSVVTRNTKDFLDIDGLTVVNPWQSH